MVPFAQNNHFVWAGSFFGELGAGAGEEVKTHRWNSDPLECSGVGYSPEHSHPIALQNREIAQSQWLRAMRRQLAAKPVSISSPLFLANTTPFDLTKGPDSDGESQIQ